MAALRAQPLVRRSAKSGGDADVTVMVTTAMTRPGAKGTGRSGPRPAAATSVTAAPATNAAEDVSNACGTSQPIAWHGETDHAPSTPPSFTSPKPRRGSADVQHEERQQPRPGNGA